MATEPVFSHPIRLGKRGPSTFAVLAKATNLAIEQGDVFIMDTTGADCTVTLPKARGNRGRMIVIYKQVAANKIVVNVTAGDTIGYGVVTTLNLVGINDRLVVISDGGTCWLKFI